LPFIAHFSVSCYIFSMSVTQTVEIPASHRLVIEVPREVPAGKTILTFTPATDQKSTDQGSDASFNRKPISRYFGILSPDTYGDSVTYQRKLRDEWND